MSPTSIFENVQQTFLDSLSDRERRSFQPFPNARSMLASIEQTVQDGVINRGRLTACLSHVRSLADRFSPFFEVCGIFVSSNPKFAAAAWGAVRLVFQLGSTHVTFLEKICDMFGQMQRILPAYEEIAEKLLSGTYQKDEGMPVRMLSALAFVYSDVMRFCLDACNIFTRRRSILGLKWPLAATLLWQPFDIRFESILNRFKEHKDLMDLEMNTSTHLRIVKVAEKVDSMLKNAESQSKIQDEVVETQKRVAIQQRLESLRSWIDPPNWLDFYEIVESRRVPETSAWFLESPQVRCWLESLESRDNSPHCNILSVHGKPGYGKTNLCTALISHILSNHKTSTENAASCDVVFFYFDKQSRRARQVSNAYRAILAQLLQIRGGSKQGIDIASLFWHQTRSGQQTASDNEVKELLAFIINQTRHLVLLVDGSDECDDPRSLFTSLQSTGLISKNHSVAFFGRPSVALPKSISSYALNMTLKNEQNFDDIRRYLQRQVNEMIDDDILPEEIDVERTVEKISSRANGMFLWVTLLVEYLHLASPAMTMKQRRHTIENLNRLEGLDALYGAIIKSISEKFPGEARQNIQHLFQWVVCSSRPLLVSELNCAATIPLDRKLEDDDKLSGLSQSLSLISGALLELAPDQTVRFIHLSALEYFQDPTSRARDSNASKSQHSFESFGGPEAYMNCSMACLSYIYYTVGAGPLSGATQISSTKTRVGKEYPFLDYASEYLFQSMLKAITMIWNRSTTSDLDSFTPFLDLTKSFLSSKKIMTTWIEACWTFGRKPNIANEEDQIARILTLKKDTPLHCKLFEYFEHCIQYLSRLEEDLSRINEAWAKVLVQTPNEIWEPSISAYFSSAFLLSVKGSTLTTLDTSDTGSQFKCINSRVSADGTEVAIIKVQPPVDEVIDCDSIGEPLWRIRYEIWSLELMTIRFCTTFNISGSMVPCSYIWERGKDSNDGPTLEFIFPTTINSDVRHATFLNVAGSVVDETRNISTGKTKPPRVAPKMQFQDIDVSLKTDVSICGTFNFDWASFHNGFWTSMSDSGEFLLVLHLLPAVVAKRIDKSANIPRAKVWFVRVYRNEQFPNQCGPSFKLLSAIAFTPDQVTELKDHPFTFHPQLPLLLFASGRTVWIERLDREIGVFVLNIAQSELERNVLSPASKISTFEVPVASAGTLIWNFTQKGSSPISIKPRLTNVRFSNNGTKIYGTSKSEKIMVEVPFGKLGIDNDHEVFGGQRDLAIADQQISLNSKSAISALSSGPSPTTQQPNSLIFARDAQGQSVVTELHQSHDHGALVLRTLHGATFTEKTLTRLPSWVDKEAAATLLNQTRVNGQEPDEVVRVILNRATAPFKKFSSNEPYFAPTLLERDQQTIPTYVADADELRQGGAGSARGMLSLE